jgi:hypothetical protein
MSSAMLRAPRNLWLAGLLVVAATLVAVPAAAQDAPADAPAGAAPAAEPPVPSPPVGFEPVAAPASPVSTWTPPPPRERRSTAMMVTGIVSGALGVLAAGAGSAMYVASDAQQCVVGGTGADTLDLRTSADCRRDETLRTGGLALMIGGGAAVALGLPLIIIGARRVPVTTGLRLGPGTATLVGRF